VIGNQGDENHGQARTVKVATSRATRQTESLGENHASVDQNAKIRSMRIPAVHPLIGLSSEFDESMRGEFDSGTSSDILDQVVKREPVF
jgi:hypothetical protein